MRLLAKAGAEFPHVVEFASEGRKFQDTLDQVLIEAWVDFGGDANPLMAALPAVLKVPVNNDETGLLLRVFLAEAEAARCGSGTALDRLAEVLVIRILRIQIETGATMPGLIAGLSDPKLSRAIVAMHNAPGRAWRNQDLASIGGMSLSRFADAFRITLGETPQAYLRRWRLTLARQDISKGDRVGAVARRYGYVSSAALAHAFKRQYGRKPTAFRRTQTA